MTSPDCSDRSSPRSDPVGTLATAAFGIAVAIGLGAAFTGLDLAGLWQDELYTGWIVDPAIGFPETMSRAVRDVSPPLYYVLLWPLVKVAGTDEVGLRLFSVLCATGAILLFVAGGRAFFGLRARLFAAAMATASSYWFMQAQNARFYALGMMVGTALLLLALSALGRPRVSRATIGLFAMTAIATAIHFYLLYVSLAVLAVLFLLRPQQRIATAAWAILLLLAAVTYLRLVIAPNSFASIGANWIGNDAAWYAVHLRNALQQSLTNKAALALVICLLPGGLALLRTRRIPVGAPSDQLGGPFLCLAVPVLVLLAGGVTSFLFTPNFHSRYVLLASPFLWGLFAFLYDRSVVPAPRVLRQVVDAALAVVLLWMSTTMALNRFKPYSEPFRETAARIVDIPSCRGQEILAIVMERRDWFRSEDGIAPVRAAYEKYLNGQATVRTVFFEDLLAGTVPADLRQMLARRIDGNGCPVLAWVVHLATPEIAAEIAKAVLAVAGRSARAADLEVITIRTGLEGYIIAMKR